MLPQSRCKTVLFAKSFHYLHILPTTDKWNSATALNTLCLKKRDPDIIDCNFKKD